MCADFTNLKSEIHSLESAGADTFHVDIMDGKFVPNFAMGIEDVKAVASLSHIPIDVHLMIENPENYINVFASLGCDPIFVHAESTVHIHRALQQIKNAGKRAGIVVNPGTGIEFLEDLFSLIDFVLVMAVDPGFAGQKFISETPERVRRIKEKIAAHKKSTAIMVDGSINTQTIPLLYEAGCEYFVAGTSGLFNKKDDYTENIRKLKNCCKQ
jgi:ribulose-phosphate 3-epimerase